MPYQNDTQSSYYPRNYHALSPVTLMKRCWLAAQTHILYTQRGWGTAGKVYVCVWGVGFGTTPN